MHNTNHRCNNIQMFSLALCMASILDENFSVLGMYLGKKCTVM